MSLVDYSANPNQRTPCVLVLDASLSMEQREADGRTRISALNEGLKAFHDALAEDHVALSRVQLAIVVVGGPNNRAEIMMDWTDANNFIPFEISSDGATPLGAGIQLGLDLIEESKQDLGTAGISYTRPWMLIISDGGPTDPPGVWETAVDESKSAELAKKVEIFTIGVEGANINKLSEISAKPPAMLSGIKFSELFVWLSNSLGEVSRSRPGEELSLPDTDPWRNVKI